MKPFLAIAVSMVASIPVGLCADTPIQLPSGDTVKDSFFEVHPNWYGMFPEETPAFVEKYPSGNLLGIHAQKKGKLDGSSVTLYEGGHLKILANYSAAHLQGPLRAWDSSNRKLLYAEYKDNEKHGMVCLFRSGTPCLIQEWKKGELQGEGLLSLSKDNGYVCTSEKQLAAEDSNEFGKAKAKLAKLDEVLAEYEGDLKRNAKSWYSKIDKQITDEYARIVKPLRIAQSVARRQAKAAAEAEMEHAAAVAIDNHHPTYRGNPYIHGSYHAAANANSALNAATEANRGASRVAARSAQEGARATARNAAAVQQAAQEATEKLKAKIVADFKTEHHFAMQSLEKSLAGDRTEARH